MVQVPDTDRHLFQRLTVQEAACGQGYALQTLAHSYCAELSPDEGLPLGGWLFGIPLGGISQIDGRPDR